MRLDLPPFPERPVAEDRPASTVTGDPFTIPASWSVSVKGPTSIITLPEGGSHIVYVDVEAEDAESALAKAGAGWKEPALAAQARRPAGG